MTTRAPAVLRKLRSSERAALRAHLLRLSSQDRRSRFCAPVSDASIARYAALDGPHRALVIGWHVDGVLRAAGEMVTGNPDGRGFAGAGSCEIALSVEREYQGRGFATALLRWLIVLARNRGVGELVLTCLPENDRMRRIATCFGARLTEGGGQIWGRLRPSAPSVESLFEEAVADGGELVRYAFDVGLTRRIREPCLTAKRDAGRIEA